MFRFSTVPLIFLASLLSQMTFAQQPLSPYKRVRDSSADNLNFIGIENHVGSTANNSTVSYHWCRVTGLTPKGTAVYDCSSSYLGCRQGKPYTYAEVDGERRELRWRGVGVTVLDVGLIALTAGGAAWAAGGATVGTAAVTTVEAGTAIPAIMRIDGAMILRLLRPLGTWSVFGVSVFGVAKYVKVLDPISRFVSASTLTYEIYGAGGAGVDEVKTLSGFGVEINTSLCEIDRREIREDKIKAGLAKIPRP